MRNIFVISLAFILGCSSVEKKFLADVENGNCEQALEKIPENETGAKLLSKTQNAGGVVLSYALTGAAYTGEILLDVVGGTIMFVALCGPPLALGVIASANSSGSSGSGYTGNNLVCFPGKFEALMAPDFGKQTFHASKNLRCPNLSGMSRSIRRVAACFSKRDRDKDLERASQTLLSLQQARHFYECLPEDEKKNIADEVNSINLKKLKL